MSNLTSSLLCLSISLLTIWLFYLLIKKWSKFHLTLIGKVLKVIYVGLLFIMIVSTLFGAYLTFSNYWEDDRVRVVNEFQGVQLGWSKDEVFFRKGKPAQLSSDDYKDSQSQYLDYGTLVVELENNKVIRIIVDCDSKDYSYKNVGGISCDSDVNRVVDLYGESKELSVSDDKLSRIYNYPQYNLALVLSKSKVQSLMVFDGIRKPKGFHFVEQPKVTLEQQDLEKEYAKAIPEEKATSKPFHKDQIVKDEKIDESQIVWDKSKANDGYVTDPKLLAELNSDNSKLVPENDLPVADNTLQKNDHCAPDLKKSERLRRLALNGTVRETGYQTYTVGNYEIAFSGNEVISCK